MYFNKKYQHTGALFEGPYKSVHITDEPRLLHLTRFLHQTGGSSSYAQYLGTRVTSWVKPKVVQSFFDKAKTDLSKETHSYKDFVEKYELNQKEKELIESITFDSEAQHLERMDLARDVEEYPTKIPTQSSEKIYLKTQNLKPLQRIPELLATVVVFLLLVTFGIRNITDFTPKSLNPSPPPAVLSETETTSFKPLPTPPLAGPTPEVLPVTAATEEAKPKIILTIKINDASASANIRQKPTTDSEKIGQAKNGDSFEFVSIDSGWYEVKLATGSGFISAAFIEVMEEISK